MDNPLFPKLLPFESILPKLVLLDVDEFDIVDGEIEILPFSFVVVVESGRSINRF